MDKAAAAVVVILLVTAYFVFERRVRGAIEPSRPVAAQPAPSREPSPVPAATETPPVPAQPEPAAVEPSVPGEPSAPAEKPRRHHRHRSRRPAAKPPEPDAPIPPAPSRVATATPAAAREPPAPSAPSGLSGRHVAEAAQPVGVGHPAVPAPSGPAAPSVLNYVAYTARFLVVAGARMRSYATFPIGTESALYTHGVALGHQTQEFKNAVYLGFGTQWGGGPETLQRYELSWQFAWAPLGTEGLFNPHIGFRLGGMMAASDRLTGGSVKPGVILAPQVGLDVQAGRHVVLTGALSYDANLGPDLGPEATLSGYAYELSAAARF